MRRIVIAHIKIYIILYQYALAFNRCIPRPICGVVDGRINSMYDNY